MKHGDDCTCRECRQREAAAPSSRITIPLATIPGVVSEAIRIELETQGLSLVRYARTAARSVDSTELADVLRVIANNVTASLQGLDESPIEQPAPRLVRGKR